VFTPTEYGAVGLSEEDAIKTFGQDNVEVFLTEFTSLELQASTRVDQLLVNMYIAMHCSLQGLVTCVDCHYCLKKCAHMCLSRVSMLCRYVCCVSRRLVLLLLLNG
jgi:hypothetical protein